MSRTDDVQWRSRIHYCAHNTRQTETCSCVRRTQFTRDTLVARTDMYVDQASHLSANYC